MIAGAGATLQQQFGIQPVIGAVIIAALAGLTVMLGLNKLVDIIGKIGPAIIVLCLLAGLVGIINGNLSFQEAEVLIPGSGIIAASGTVVGFHDFLPWIWHAVVCTIPGSHWQGGEESQGCPVRYYHESQPRIHGAFPQGAFPCGGCIWRHPTARRPPRR